MTQYLVITEKGYWGLGKTPLEAANVNYSYVRGSVFQTLPNLTKNLECTEMGAAAWEWTEKTRELMKLEPTLSTQLKKAACLGKGDLRLVNVAVRPIGKTAVTKDEQHLQIRQTL